MGLDPGAEPDPTRLGSGLEEPLSQRSEKNLGLLGAMLLDGAGVGGYATNSNSRQTAQPGR